MRFRHAILKLYRVCLPVHWPILIWRHQSLHPYPFRCNWNTSEHMRVMKTLPVERVLNDLGAKFKVLASEHHCWFEITVTIDCLQFILSSLVRQLVWERWSTVKYSTLTAAHHNWHNSTRAAMQPSTGLVIATCNLSAASVPLAWFTPMDSLMSPETMSRILLIALTHHRTFQYPPYS